MSEPRAPQASQAAEDRRHSAAVAGPLPEIILLPGFMGVHLVNKAGHRVWLDPIAMLKGDIAEKLTLDETSAEDASESMRPEALIKAIYATAIQSWVDRGLIVHPFPFDFRLSIRSLGLSLRAFIEERARRSPGTRFALVGHSMGALVAAVYAYYDPAFEERIEQSIFVGAPLFGTFDSVEAVLGSHWMLPRIASLTRGDDKLQMQHALRTWPALHDMLPDPAQPFFTNAAQLFSAASWPSDLKPSQPWLDEAKAMKEVLRTTPLYRKPTAQLLSASYGTVRELVVREGGVIEAGRRVAKGDGTVVAQTAILPGVIAYKVDFPHSLLPLDPKVIKGVSDLIQTGETDLSELKLADVEGEFDSKETPIEEMLEGVLESLTRDLGQELALSLVLRLFSRV